MYNEERDIKSFIKKSEILENTFSRVNHHEFYRDVFPVGSFQSKGTLHDEKGNGLVVDIQREKSGTSKHYTLYDDLSNLDELIEKDFIITSPISYFGNRRTSRNSSKLFGFAFDLDGVSVKTLGNLLHQLAHDLHPMPTYIVNSGHGLHLYYLFNEPINLYNHLKVPLKNMKIDLTEKLWNTHTSEWSDIQKQGIFQGFRLVGSATKFGKDYRVTAYKTGEKIDIDYLNGFVAEENKIHSLEYNAKLSLEQAKVLYPEWYERKIIQGNHEKKTWTVNRALYDWWFEKIKNEATFGARYFCVMVLSVYAQKCGISEQELHENAMSLIPRMNLLSQEPFTEIDVLSAMNSYHEDYMTYPVHEIQRVTKITMPDNKRKYRNQKIHLQMARNNLATMVEHGMVEVGRPKGSGTKEDKVLNYIKDNPEKTPTQIARDLGISRTTVYKYLKK